METVQLHSVIISKTGGGVCALYPLTTSLSLSLSVCVFLMWGYSFPPYYQAALVNCAAPVVHRLCLNQSALEAAYEVAKVPSELEPITEEPSRSEVGRVAVAHTRALERLLGCPLSSITVQDTRTLASGVRSLLGVTRHLCTGPQFVLGFDEKSSLGFPYHKRLHTPTWTFQAFVYVRAKSAMGYEPVVMFGDWYHGWGLYNMGAYSGVRRSPLFSSKMNRITLELMLGGGRIGVQASSTSLSPLRRGPRRRSTTGCTTRWCTRARSCRCTLTAVWRARALLRLPTSMSAMCSQWVQRRMGIS
jgi:hypothetical protein